MSAFEPQYELQITFGQEANSQLLDAKIKSRFLRDLANIWDHTVNFLEKIVHSYEDEYFRKVHAGVLISQVESTFSIKITVDPSKRTIETTEEGEVPVDSLFRALRESDLEANIPIYVFTTKLDDKHSLLMVQIAQVMVNHRCQEIFGWLEHKGLEWTQILTFSTNFADGDDEAIGQVIQEFSDGTGAYYVKLGYIPNADDLLKEKKSKSKFHQAVNLAWEETVRLIPKLTENYQKFDFISEIKDNLNTRSQKLSGKSIPDLEVASSEFGKEHDLYYENMWDPKKYLVTWVGDKQVSTSFGLSIGFTNRKFFSKISPFILHNPNDDYNYEIVSRDTNPHALFILQSFFRSFLEKLELELSWLPDKNLQKEDIITIMKNFPIEDQTEINHFIDEIEKSIRRIGFRIALSKSWQEIKSLKPRIRKRSFLFYALMSARGSVREDWYNEEMEKIMKSIGEEDRDNSMEAREFESNFEQFLFQSRRKSDKNEIELLWETEIPDPYSLIPKYISSVMEHIQTELETVFRERDVNWRDYAKVELINL